MNILKKSLIVALLTMSLFSAANAVEISEVVSTSPSWNTFTNKDGTGLYHEILREVFGLYGVSVRHEYSKSSRSEEMVALGLADMMTCDDKASPAIVMGKYPMYESSYYVFFNKARIGPWRGAESMRDKEILSQPSYYAQANFPVPVSIREVPTGAQALGMVLLGRSDFYVDDMTLIKQSMDENTIDYRKDQFDIKEAGRRSYHPLFNTTDRGRAIRKMYEEGMDKLHKAGKLKPIFDKWGHPYPDFDRY